MLSLKIADKKKSIDSSKLITSKISEKSAWNTVFKLLYQNTFKMPEISRHLLEAFEQLKCKHGILKVDKKENK